MQDIAPLAEGDEPTMNEGCQECTGGSPYLTDISKSDKPWDKHRRNSEIVQKLYLSSQLPQYGQRIGQCSRELMFVLEANSEGEAKFRLRQAKFCRVRNCPTCQWRRTLVWRARLINALPNVLRDHPKARWIFVTLTVANCPLTELRATVETMNKAWHRLIKRKQFPAIGFIRSLEVTRNPKTGEAHPHFHVLMMVPPSYFSTGYISQDKWRELWGSCLKVSYLPVVHVQTVKDKSGKDSVIHGVLETAKYGVKEEDLIFSKEWLEELTIQLHKTRAVNVGGLLKNYLRDDEPEDLVNTDENEEIDSTDDDELKLWFDWIEMVRRYKKRD